MQAGRQLQVQVQTSADKCRQVQDRVTRWEAALRLLGRSSFL